MMLNDVLLLSFSCSDSWDQNILLNEHLNLYDIN